MDFSAKQTLHNLFKEAASSCKNCELSSVRKNIVLGEGNVFAPLFIVGEAPGQNEDEQGIPFVGRAGKKLDEILKFFKLERDKNTYITNTVLCRPPGNRTPLFNEEILACNRRLMCQIYLIKPKVILGLGAAAAKALIGQDKVDNLGELCDTSHEIAIDDFKCPVAFSYHPSYLLRKQKDKEVAAKARSHWEKVIAILNK